MIKDLIIVGAGHMAIDICWLIEEQNKLCPTWNIKGFINDVPTDLSRYGIDYPIIGTIKDFLPAPTDNLAIAIGNPVGKAKVVNLLKSRGAHFVSLISPHAIVHKSAKIGEGAIIASASKIAANVTIGPFCVIGDTTVAMNTVIGEYTNTASYANIYQNLVIGKRVQVWSHAVVLKNLGDDVVVGAGSVVTNRVKTGMKVFGCPAQGLAF